MDFEPMIRSYRIYLQARIQSVECQSFGGGLYEGFMQEIAEHQEAEERFVNRMLEERAAHVAELKAVSHK